LIANVASCLNATPACTGGLAADGDAIGVNVIVEGGTSGAVGGALAGGDDAAGVAIAEADALAGGDVGGGAAWCAVVVGLQPASMTTQTAMPTTLNARTACPRCR